jgi:Pleckstrin homology domain
MDVIDARSQETANHVGSLQLSHSLAHALPPPGYNRQRPFCMVLTLASGAVYFFQAGTEELVNEWVQTCNYWAARQSKEPLAGGVSNMEYGWNRVSDVLQPGRATSDDESVRIPDFTDTASVRSARSNHSRFSRKDVAATMRIGSPRSDRTNITEWKSPLAPSVPSTHDEEAQLEALKKHVAALTQELQEHNELRGPMMALVRTHSTFLTSLFPRLLRISLHFFSIPHARRVRQRRLVTGKGSRSTCLRNTSSTNCMSIRCRRP